MIPKAKHPIRLHKAKKRTKYLLLTALILVTVAVSSVLPIGMHFFALFSYPSPSNDSKSLLSMSPPPLIATEHSEETTSATEKSCGAKVYHQLCLRFDGADSLKCHKHPKEFLEKKFSEYTPSETEMKARALMKEKKITHLSVGAAKSKICSDVIRRATLCTDRAELDLFELNSWLNLLQSTISYTSSSGGSARSALNSNGHNDGGFEVIFSEHVLEHFDPMQVQYIAAAAFAVLKPGGIFRIAVPDGYKPSPSYQTYIRPGGTPSGAGQNHMVAWTVDTLPTIFRTAGFDIIPREHFDAHGHFHSATDAYDKDDVYGKVNRSLKHDVRNMKPYKSISNTMGTLNADDLKPDEPMYTSLWFDAVKPLDCDVLLNTK
jgi:Uncharacterized protein conserved in bacteria